MTPSPANPASPTMPAARPESPVGVDAVRALARATRMLERASGELSLAHYRVLSAIAAGEERASRVARRLALGKPTVSASVEALVQRGLLTRREVAGDQRGAALQVTKAGAAVLARAEGDMVGLLDDLCARTAHPEAVRQALVELGAAIEDLRSSRAGAPDGP